MWLRELAGAFLWSLVLVVLVVLVPLFVVFGVVARKRRQE